MNLMLARAAPPRGTLREFLQEYVRYLAAGVGAIPAGALYVWLLARGVDGARALYGSLALAVALSQCAWPVVGRWIKRDQFLPRLAADDYAPFQLLPDYTRPRWIFPLAFGVCVLVLLCLRVIALAQPASLNLTWGYIRLTPSPPPPPEVGIHERYTTIYWYPNAWPVVARHNARRRLGSGEIKIPQVGVPGGAVPPPAISSQLSLSTRTFHPDMTAPTIAEVPRAGSFGDRNGVPAKPSKGSPPTVGEHGPFETPPKSAQSSIEGYLSAHGVVSKPGPGQAPDAISGTGGRASAPDSVAFMSFNSSPAETGRATTPRLEPVELLSKPTPEYTDEARKLGVEGDVKVDVMFEASGKVAVLDVTHRLGHGLDHAATLAVEGIHFEPALLDGRPTDVRATLTVQFRIATSRPFER